MVDIGESQNTGVTRRTVTKAMAWAVPAIAVAAPVPAYASSGTITISNAGACKSPGSGKNCQAWNKGYVVGFDIGNTHTDAIRVTFSNLRMTAGITGTWTLFNDVVVVSANGTERVGIGLDNNRTSQQTSGSGLVDAYWENVDNPAENGWIYDIPFSFNSTNPCVQMFGTNCPPKG
ncbi:hypothetical protein [Microbacterium sp. EF45047]|uniref:hypothetical protein n=1 Tax=Microbacterium sp. EF45047 TaxID=2809708 RepID=UPI00234B7744|nr:hypothetical protein [Microbacterium sp. EF45047]WCM56071.1 hypothetical protein JRG78_02235 [Microbacterium sp. EF45047]